MKIAFVTHVSDDKIVHFGALKLINSFYKFHPDIPLYVFTNNDISEACKNYPNINWFYLNPVISQKLAEAYDLVVHIDADSIVVDRLTEVLEGDYDVATVRNNNDFQRAGTLPAYTLNNLIDPLLYANCGLVASTKKDFWNEWIHLNNVYFNKFELHEQDVMNLLLSHGKYKVKLLDPIEKPIHYGISNQYGFENHWDSWKEIEIHNEKLYLNNKLIKILHHAGGSGTEKLNIDKLFKADVTKHIKKICNIVMFD
jgi:hypothetical protein